MAGTTDFLPFATADDANVASQSAYADASTTSTGYESGEASSALCNKSWRQAAFQSAVLATFTANTLDINVPDDGDLTAAVNNFASALSAVVSAGLTGYATQSWVGASYQTIANATNASTLTTGTLPEARLPASFSVGGTITAGGFNYSSDEGLKKNIRPITGAIERMKKLRGLLFDWNNGKPDAGVTAQDVMLALPESGGDGRHVNAGAIIGLLVATMNEVIAVLEAR